MKICTGDNVIVIAGNDRGKTGTIQKVQHGANRVIVEGVNLRYKHLKPTQQNPKGDPTKEIRGPFRASTNDTEDSGRSQRAHSCEEDRRGQTRQGRKLGRNVESGYGGPTNREGRYDRGDEPLEPPHPQPVFSHHFSRVISIVPADLALRMGSHNRRARLRSRPHFGVVIRPSWVSTTEP